MKPVRKRAFPVERVRRFLEPGPVLLLCTQWRDERAVMTLGWHMMLGYDLVGTYIWDANRSHALARRSRECTINLPTADLLDVVVGIGNCSSREVDKFERFGLDAAPSRQVAAPGIAQCLVHAEASTRLVLWELNRILSALADGPAINLVVLKGCAYALAGLCVIVAAVACGGESVARAALPLHELCLFKLGIHLGELWYLSELAAHLRATGRSRFLLTAPPLRLPGAVGSPATPVATV